MLSVLRQMFRLGTSAAAFTYRDPRASIFFGGSESKAGVAVTTENALYYSPWWRGIQLVSDAVARTPIAPYAVASIDAEDMDDESDGVKTIARDHPSYSLLHRKPNYFQTPYDWKKLMISQKLSAGNAYSYVVRDASGRPVQLVPLDPQATTPVVIRPDGSEWATVPGPRDEVWYVWWPQGRSPIYLPKEDVLHFKGLSAEGLWGYSVVGKAREAIGLGLGQQIYASTFFANGGRPSVVLMHPMKLSDEAKSRLSDAWDRKHGGANQHTTAVLDAGLTAKEMAFSAADAQLIESREFNIRDVANYLGVPAHKLGDTSKTGYASLEQENLSFFADTLSSHYVSFEQELMDKLLLESEKEADSHLIEFADAVLRGTDLTTKANFARTALGGAPFLSVDEARGIFGLNPSGDPKMREIAAPLNQGKGSDQQQEKTAPEPSQPNPDRNALLGAAYRMALATCKRLATRAAHQATAAAKTPGKFLAFADGYDQANRATALEEFEPAEDAVRAATGKAPSFAVRFVRAVASQLKQIAERATAKTLQAEVAAACGGLAETLGKEIEGQQ